MQPLRFASSSDVEHDVQLGFGRCLGGSPHSHKSHSKHMESGTRKMSVCILHRGGTRCSGRNQHSHITYCNQQAYGVKHQEGECVHVHRCCVSPIDISQLRTGTDSCADRDRSSRAMPLACSQLRTSPLLQTVSVTCGDAKRAASLSESPPAFLPLTSPPQRAPPPPY
jgi:hypothetical protein